MAVVVLTGAAGSPGVTTTAISLAAAWPRPALLVEADPSGTSAILPGYLRGQVPAYSGIVEAAVALRQGRLAAALPGLLMDLPELGATLLPGLATPAQRLTLAHEWATLGPELTALARARELDLIVDAGRLGGAGYPHALLHLADLVAVVTRSSLRSIHATSSWLTELNRELPDPQRVQIILIGQGRPYSAAEIAKHTGVRIVGALGWSPEDAAVLSDGARPPRKPGSLGADAARLAVAITTNLPGEFPATPASVSGSSRELAHA